MEPVTVVLGVIGIVVILALALLGSLSLIDHLFKFLQNTDIEDVWDD